MPASDLIDLSRCAVHTMTNKPWSLRECIDAYAAVGIRGISVWRNVIEPIGVKQAGRMLCDAGMHVPALVRGGFFVATDTVGRQAAIDINRACIDEAREIGAEMIVLVVGAAPGIPLVDARKQVADGIAAVLPDTLGAGVKRLEPELVFAGQPDTFGASGGSAGRSAWVEFRPYEHPPARVSLGGRRWKLDEVDLSDLLSVVDETEEHDRMARD